MNLSGKTALITGAGSGIGRATSISLAKRGCNIIITDINENGLGETEALLKSYPVKVDSHFLDVADEAAINAFAEQIQAQYGKLDLLFNNAGVALGGNFDQVNAEEFDWLMSINFWGVVRMCRAFLPLLKQSNDAQIINISSVFGIFGVPGQVAYCASKFGVRGFSEALRLELADINIGVTVVHPGGINTNIAKSSRIAASADLTQEQIDHEKETFSRLLTLDPAIAGETIVKGVERRQKRVLIGNDARILALVVRLFPVEYWRILKSIIPV